MSRVGCLLTVRIGWLLLAWSAVSGSVKGAALQSLLLSAESLSLSIPAYLTEGETTKPQGASVSISSSRPTNVVVVLEATSQVLVPEQVIIPAGQTKTVFHLSVPDNSLYEGERTVQLVANAPGYDCALAQITIADNDVARLTFDYISSPQYVGVPLLITITAEDINGRRVESFSGSASLEATASGEAPAPSVTNAANFKRGEWTGQLAFDGPGQRVQLVAQLDPGATGISAPFRVEPAPVREAPFAVQDASYDPTSGCLYATVFGSNAIVQFDPLTGEVRSTIPLGEPLGAGAAAGFTSRSFVISDDAHFGFVSVSNGFYIRQVDLRTRTLGPRFASGWDSVAGNLFALDMFVVPGANRSLVVAGGRGFYNGRGVFLYENGVVRSNNAGWNINAIEPSDNPGICYGYNGSDTSFGLSRIFITPSGLTTTHNTAGLLAGFNTDFTYGGGRLFSAVGRMVDPEARSLLEVFEVPAFSKAVAVDSGAGRVFFAAREGHVYRVQATDIAAGVPVGVFEIRTSEEGFVGRLFRWGESGLGLLSSSGKLYLIQTSVLMPSGLPTTLLLSQTAQPYPPTVGAELTFVLTVTNAGPEDAYETVVTDVLPRHAELVATHASSGTFTVNSNTVRCRIGFLPANSQATIELIVRPKVGGWTTNKAYLTADAAETNLADNVSLQPVLVQVQPPPYGYAEIRQASSDLVYHAPTRSIYASVPSGSEHFPDSLLPVSLDTGALGNPIPVGPQPGKLALSADNEHLYFISETNRAIRRWNFQSNAIDLLVPVAAASGGQYTVHDLEVLPGMGESLAVLRTSFGFSSEVAVYDRDQMRPVTASVFADGYPERIELGENPLRVYAQNDGLRGFARVDVVENGAQLVDVTTGITPIFVSLDLEWAEGRLFTSHGTVIDPAIPAVVTNVPGIVAPSPLIYEPSEGRLFFLAPSGADWEVRAYDPLTLELLGALPVRNVIGSPGSLVRCGSDHLAFRTSGDQIFIVGLPFATEADVAVSQRYTPGSAVSGLDMDVVLQVTNRSMATVTGVVVTNPLPARTQLLSFTPSQGSATRVGDTLFWAVGSLPASGSAALTVSLRSTNSAAGSITNRVEVSCNAFDPVLSNNVSVETILVVMNTNSRPIVVSQEVNEVKSTTAELIGRVSPNGLPTVVYFVYGPDPNPTQETEHLSIGASRAQVEVKLPIEGLSPQTTYYFHAVATNGGGTVFETNSTFTTSLEPLITTLPATDIQYDGATLNAAIQSHGLAGRIYFQYGPTTNYGLISRAIDLPAGLPECRVAVPVIGLSVGTAYHARAVVSNAAGLVIGGNVSFSTLPLFQVSTGGLTGMSSSALAWGDYDRDGWLDVLLSGTVGRTNYASRLYRNNGDGTFSDSGVALPSLVSSSLAWCDYDNDGFLDFYLAGETAEGVRLARLYRNLGTGDFLEVDAGLPGLAAGAVAWADFDGDGMTDLLVAGLTQANNEACLLFRNYGGVFSNVVAQLPGFHTGSVDWGDFDNDGDPDILLTGKTGPAGVSRVYRNEGSGLFTALPSPWPQVSGGMARWGDYNNDGLLDFVLLGHENVFELYSNGGDGVFSKVDAQLPRLAADSVQWGDYDLDGFLDILMTGEKLVSSIPDTINRSLFIFINHRHGTFQSLNLGLPEVWNSSAAWADFDADGRLDFLVAGHTRDGHSSRLYRNNLPRVNCPPPEPAGLTAMGDANVILSWNAVADADAAAGLITYNLRVGTAPGQDDVISAHANGTNGLRHLPAFGNRFYSTNVQLFLPAGDYYWSVQAVDAAFAGGRFAPEVTFTIPPILKITASGTNTMLSWPVTSSGWVLQESLSLSPDGWRDCQSGPTNPLVIQPGSPVKFYRLFRPQR